jgi:hypothetical protein
LVNNQYQLVVVVAIQHLDVDAGLGHLTGQLAELSGHGLAQAQADDIADLEHPNTGKLKSASGGFAVGKKKVRGTALTYQPGATAFDTDAGSTQGITHLGEGARAIVENHRNVLHARFTPSLSREPVRSEFR